MGGKNKTLYVFAGKMLSDLEVKQKWQMVEVRRENRVTEFVRLWMHFVFFLSGNEK